jgi:hypothetical protein
MVAVMLRRGLRHTRQEAEKKKSEKNGSTGNQAF